MRRFKQSVFARFAILVSSFLLLGFAFNTAQAQFRTAAKQWAVLDFVNKSNLGGPALGGAAADAVSTLLLGTNRFDILPRETVERIYREMELTPPLTRDLDILRVGQALSTEIVITGEIKEARINKTKQGKSADVILIVRGIDVASGMVVLAAAAKGQSSERPGEPSDDMLLNEAVNYGAQKAVDTMLTQQVDIATVLATPTVNTVQLNKGSRQGLKLGMHMVITRGREQVAKVRISDVSTDVATASVVSSSKGVAPGDKARAVFSQIPDMSLSGRTTGARVRSSFGGAGAGSSLLALLVVGAIAMTIAGGSGDTGPGEFTSEATVLDDRITPGVKLSWRPSIFAQGRGRVEWQVWRNDYQPTPVLIVNGTESQTLDHPTARVQQWRDMGTIIGGTECVDDPGAEDFENPAPGITPGTTYLYLVSLVYKLSALDVPGGGGGGTGDDCFFQTGRQAAIGAVTPVTPVVLQSPINGATDIGAIVQFSWQSTPGADQYIVELSTQSNFANRNNIRVLARIDSLLVGGVSTDPIDLTTVFPTTARVYWRVGARNSIDVPGPVKDVMGERYVFSLPFQMDRIIPPPPPPGSTGKGGGKGKG